LWRHLRSEPIPRGFVTSSADWVAWKERYWELRGDLVTNCKQDLVPERAGATVNAGGDC
jgi:hypothetical protein